MKFTCFTIFIAFEEDSDAVETVKIVNSIIICLNKLK